MCSVDFDFLLKIIFHFYLFSFIPIQRSQSKEKTLLPYCMYTYLKKEFVAHFFLSFAVINKIDKKMIISSLLSNVFHYVSFRFSSMARFCLDILPVELLHALFSYFLAHEILLTFTNVSPYIDAILVSYPNYRVDFKSILKTHFNLVCRTVIADQILSLTLSGLDDTPKQCQLFFTHFRIEYFSRLRSIGLINIDKQLMKHIVNFIDKLNRHCQISLDNSDIRTLVSSPVICQLTRLRITDRKQFAWTNWSDLLPFDIGRSSITTVQYICMNAPKLQSLDICLEHNGSNIALAFPVPQLTRLVLKVKGKYF